MKKTIKRLVCLALVVALCVSFAGCAKLNYVTNGTIQAIQEVKSGEWLKTDEEGEEDEKDVSVLETSFEAGTYGGVEFKSLEDVVNYYNEAYNYTKTLTASYDDNGNKETYYKLIGEEALEIGDVMIDGKSNATVNNLVPGIVGGLFAASSYGLIPCSSRNPKYDNNSGDDTRKEDIDFTTSHFEPDFLLDANVVDNGDGTITLTMQPKEETLAFRGAGPQGAFFEALGDINGVVSSITLVKFEEGTVDDNVKVRYIGGTGTVTIDTKTKEVIAADYDMKVKVAVSHASIAVIKNKNAKISIDYKLHYPASDEYLADKGIKRL